VASLAGLPYRRQAIARSEHVRGDLARDFFGQFFIEPGPGLRGRPVIDGHGIFASLCDRIAALAETGAGWSDQSLKR
jgi:hypothetical protein